jgi:hypothetical protein
MAPPEDGSGNRTYSENVQKLLKLKARSPMKFYQEWKELIKRAYNYKDDQSVDSRNWDPLAFDVAQAQARIDEAIKTPPSTHSGTTMMYKLQPDADPGAGFVNPNEKLSVVQDPEMANRFELKTEHKDPLALRTALVCNQCGSPNDLKRCQACRAVVYCSPTCQK